MSAARVDLSDVSVLTDALIAGCESHPPVMTSMGPVRFGLPRDVARHVATSLLIEPSTPVREAYRHALRPDITIRLVPDGEGGKWWRARCYVCGYKAYDIHWRMVLGEAHAHVMECSGDVLADAP